MHLPRILNHTISVWTWQMPIEFHIQHTVRKRHRMTFFFGFRKEKLRGIAHTDEQNLISCAQAICDDIPELILPSVHMTWMKRLRWAIENRSECYSKWEPKIAFSEKAKVWEKVMNFWTFCMWLWSFASNSDCRLSASVEGQKKSKFSFQVIFWRPIILNPWELLSLLSNRKSDRLFTTVYRCHQSVSLSLHDANRIKSCKSSFLTLARNSTSVIWRRMLLIKLLSCLNDSHEGCSLLAAFRN
jgi:hypothetical protein